MRFWNLNSCSLKVPPRPSKSSRYCDQGNPQRGRALFHDARAANCVACHALENRGQVLAPDLMDIFSRSKPEVLIQSILDPSAVITEGFASQAVETTDGETYSGLVVSESGRIFLLPMPLDRLVRSLKVR